MKFPIFPVEPGGKKPLTEHGFLDATIDEATIRQWWTRWPDANVAMPTGAGTYDVLDVDVRPSGSGMPAFERLNEAGLLSGALRIIRTPSGGLHIYFPGTTQPSSTIKGLHLDLKAAGGYVLIPPSKVTTPDYSGTYSVARDFTGEATGEVLDWAACRALLAPAPIPSRPAPGDHGQDIGALAAWLRKQQEGNRNGGLYWAARRAIESGCNDPTVLVEAALSIGLDEREIYRTLASARRFGGVS